MKLWLLAAILLFAVPLTAEDTVLDRLSKVEQFAFGPTGYAGVISEGEKDYKAVLASSTALPDFEKLLSEGNIQAKCYALVGIHKLNAARFKELVRSLDSKQTVSTMEGCIIFRVPFTHVLKQIAAGKY